MMLSTRLVKASACGNVKDVKKLIAKGAIFTKDQDGNTALHEACRNGYGEVVSLLLKANCYVDMYNSRGLNPLHLACQQGHTAVARVLLRAKANPLLANKHGETGLHIAAKYNHPDVIASFADSKANLNVLMENGDTALHVAAKYGNLTVLRALLVGGADPFIRNKEGWLPLETAERCGHSEAKVLLECMMKDKYKDYRPSALQQQFHSSFLESREKQFHSSFLESRERQFHSSFLESREGAEEETSGGDSGKKQRPKFLSKAFSRFRRGSASSSLDTPLPDPPPGSHPAKDGGSQPVEQRRCSSTSSDNHDGPATLRPTAPPLDAGCRLSGSGLEEGGGAGGLGGRGDPKRRSISFSEMPPQVMNRMYESLDNLAEEGVDPVVRAIPPPPSPILSSRKEPMEDYVAMAPSKTHGAGQNLVNQWTKSLPQNTPPTNHKPMLQMPGPVPPSSSTPSASVEGGALNIQEELDTMRRAFEIRLNQLEKRYQRRAPDGPPSSSSRPLTWSEYSCAGDLLHSSHGDGDAYNLQTAPTLPRAHARTSTPTGSSRRAHHHQDQHQHQHQHQQQQHQAVLQMCCSTTHLRPLGARHRPIGGGGGGASTLHRRSGSADLLKDCSNEPEPRPLQLQSGHLYCQSADRIGALGFGCSVQIAPATPPSPAPMIDAYLSSNSDSSSVINFVLGEEDSIGCRLPGRAGSGRPPSPGPAPGPAPGSRRWFELGSSSCEDDTSVCATSVVSMLEPARLGGGSSGGGRSNATGNELLKWIPREVARSKLKEKLKVQKVKFFQQFSRSSEILDRPCPPPTSQQLQPIKTPPTSKTTPTSKTMPSTSKAKNEKTSTTLRVKKNNRTTMV